MNRRAQTYVNVRAYDMYYVHVTRGTREWAIYMHWYVPFYFHSNYVYS